MTIYYWRIIFIYIMGVFGGIGNIVAQGDCLIINISNIQCQAASTPNNTFDDAYTFDMEITGGSSGWILELENETITGSYGNIVTLGPYKVIDGPKFLLVSDALDRNCATVYTLTPPTCSNCINSVINNCDGADIVLAASAQNLWGYSNYTSFQWYRDGVAISGAIDSTFQTNMLGRYTVRAYDHFFSQTLSCFDESCCSFIIQSGPQLQAVDDLIDNGCPGLSLTGNVSFNDSLSIDAKYTLVSPPSTGTLLFDSIGFFEFNPAVNACLTEQFIYQVCHGSCCDTAIVNLELADAVAPILVDIPADNTISCDELIAVPPLVSAFDNCPAISIKVTEDNTQGEDGCSLYQYNLTRTWTATDVCGNTATDKQTIEIVDYTAPDIFRIYTLPNGKKMVAGVMENVNKNWKTIALPIDFPTTPLIFTQVVTTKENTTVAAKIKNVSIAQFELKIQEEEAQDDEHQRESVAWIAIEAGNQDNPYPLETQKISLTDTWKTVAFEANYAVFPSFFGQIQTTNDNDPASLRFRNPSLSNIQIHIEEETSLDSEVTHPSEEVAFLGIEQGINLVDYEGNIFGETGSTSLDESWVTIRTQHTYHNPVVIAGIPQSIDGSLGVARVRNVTANSFDIQFQEWNYQDGNHALEYISYLVMEGSIPLDASIICEIGTDNLEIGKDIIALDNCDINVALQYEESEIVDGNAKQIIRTWYARDECGNATGVSQIVPCTGVGLRLKLILQGAILGSENDLMRDDLRHKNLLPTIEPYTAMESFEHIGVGGGEECMPEMFKITGEKAIVDWVFIELKQADNRAIVVSTMAALLQRDGHVITADGDSILYFENLPPDNYYVTVRHRNHLKVETLHPYLFDGKNIPFIDFTYHFLPTLGLESFIEVNGGNAIWGGDLNQDEKTIYQGPQTDIFRMFLQVVLDSLNNNYLPNFISSAYTPNDFNLDGITIYQGPNNDRSNLLFNTTLKHPNNEIKASNFVISITEQIEDLEACQIDNTLPNCDYDNDDKLNQLDSDDDNDGVIDGNDLAPYNSESDSDSDGIKDILETQNGTNPLNACDPYQDYITCQAQDLDGDGTFGNYPADHILHDADDRNACIPNPQFSNCGCADDDNDGYIYICHTTESGQKQTLKITPDQWKYRQLAGGICGICM